MFIDAKPFLDWLHLHAQWGGVIAFAIAFFECLALVGLVLPGVIFMTALGTLIGAGILSSFSSIMWCAVAGAIAGDLLSFWLGHHYKEHIRERWPFRQHPALLQKGEQFFFAHGGKGIFFGRFVGPVRPILPLIAGMMSMPVWRFLLADIPSAILWAPVYLLPGVLVGFASQEIAPGKLLLFVLGILLALWCVWWLLKRICLMIKNFIHYLFASWWKVMRNNNFCKYFLFDPLHPDSSSQLILVVISLLTLLGFFAVLINILQHGALIDWNQAVYYFMRSLRVTMLDPWLVAVTTIDPAVLTFMWAAVLVWLLVQRNRWATAHWFGLGIVAIACRFIIKSVTHFPRPPGLLQAQAGWSFPSGHALLSVTFFGFLAVLMTRYWQRDSRWLAYISAALITLIILFSRLYLGAHWFSDILGSLLLGIFLVALTTISYRRRAAPAVLTRSTFIVAVLALLVSWGWQMTHYFKMDLRGYTPVWTVQTIDSENWWQQKNNTQPLYRVDRFGKPIEVLNVQWAGPLATIEHTLAQKKWRLVPKASLLQLLNGFTNKLPDQQLPVLSRFYEDRKPILIMFKVLPSNEVLILRLWDARERLSNGAPLWVGVLNYHQPWHAHFLHHLKKLTATENAAQFLPAPTDLFRNDLSQWDWKQITYSDQPNSVLLVRSK
jgi:membrane protein DedA with SNARE-associated domain